MSTNREFYRFTLKLKGNIWNSEEGLFPITILNISAGGMLIESFSDLTQGKVIMIVFNVDNSEFRELCKVTRVFDEESESESHHEFDNTQHQYGVRFVAPEQSSCELLMKKLQNIQINKKNLARN